MCVGGGIALFTADTGTVGEDLAAQVGGILVTAIGLPPLVSGLVMVSIGASRRATYNQWRRVALAPARTPHGTWVPGLRLAF